MLIAHRGRTELKIEDIAILKRILKGSQYLTIAMAMDNEPYLVSLSYGYDEERHCLYFHCTKEGKKVAFLKRNPRVWGQILLDYTKNAFLAFYVSLHFSGRVTFLSDLNEKRRAIECLINLQASEPARTLTRLNTKALENTLLCRIDIDQISGRKSLEEKN
jgi:nitroimidazol reductase NimA-like FMN-containing flavoprotein (pyridoxamine 5'-phosphate oxidase superfamily)